MERKEKGGEREEGKSQGLMVKKLRRGVVVGKRGGGGGPCTPPPRWRLEFSTDLKHNNNNNNYKAFTEFLTTPTVSARKLCASLWDFESHHSPLAKMSKGGARIRRRHLKNNGFKLPKHLLHLSNVNPQDDDEEEEQEPVTASSLGRAASESLIKHHRSAVERNDCALQPLSPASYGSSLMEVGPYKPAVTPSSLDLKFRMGESSYSLKTSTELLKVLNRIWSLEEQHASNVSLVRALKMELDRSQARIKELLQEKQSDREQMDDLMKQITNDKLVRKSIEQDRIRAAVQSVRDELEDERKLRKRSESLHRKLARELSEMKSSFSNVLRELERERKAGILLENLCDEFAKGIRDYEQEVRSLKNKPEKHRRGIDKPERLILHISEAWLDERMQMKLAEPENDIAEKITIVDKLGFDIATFLQAKQMVETRENDNLFSKEHYLRRHSLESFPLNEAVSAPRHPADEDSTDGDSRCLEASKKTSIKQSKSIDRQHGNDATGQHEGLSKSNSARKKVRSQDLIKGTNLSEEHMSRAMSCNGNKIGCVDKDKMEREELEATDDLGQTESSKALKSDCVVDNLIRNRSLSLEANKTHSESCCREESCMQSALTGNASPVQLWKSKLATPDFEKSESSLRWPQELDENTLMAKLIEARLERRRRSRSKPSKGSS
ncbi:intracellular protein transporter USO1-like protein [Trema orientale]|uniref:Intracellular protein transporter USO1-like protein n=1 Tax=Trema orientale TaxID=63057 RepID=A0A2P5E8F3_TREOI|nr:intracellular protein transporter USO1-like protein [Trema orientale]